MSGEGKKRKTLHKLSIGADNEKSIYPALKSLESVASRLESVAAKLQNELTKTEASNNTPRPKLLSRLRAQFSVKRAVVQVTKIATLVIALIGLASSLYSLKSRVSISLRDSDPGDVFRIPIEISNDGALPIYKVFYACRVISVRSKNAPGKAPQWNPSSEDSLAYIVNDKQQIIPFIRAGQKATTTSFCPISGTPDFADLALTVFYNDVFNVSEQRGFRLVTSKDSNGKILWLQQPF